MRRLSLFLIFFLLFHSLKAQLNNALQQAVKDLEADKQMKHAILGFYVIDASSGKEIFGRNAFVGLPVASSQKVITSVSAFELLGGDFRFKTVLGHSGDIRDGVLTGNLHITGSGDPTLGSWRWSSTKDSAVLNSWTAAIKKAGIHTVRGNILIGNNNFSKQQIPDGWIWQDIGNYYGAGAGPVNWHENQYDLFLQSGNRVGDKVELLPLADDVQAGPFVNELVTAAKGTGDNAYIYLPVGDAQALLKGTIPAGEKRFSVSGALPDPVAQLKTGLISAMQAKGIHFTEEIAGNKSAGGTIDDTRISVLSTLYSPSFDSMNHWFLKRSINLYGESFIKTIALEKNGYASTHTGISLIKEFWADKGLDSAAINIGDGSGLSPLNRVTPSALVHVMKYARSQPWFRSFYNALPEINGIRMKSGTIGGVKSFTGYVRSTEGKEFCFAIIVSNYTGPSSSIVNRIYKVLNVLK